MSQQPQAPPEAPKPQQAANPDPAAQPDSQAVLDKLRRDLAKAEADAQSAGTRIKSLKADLTALEKALQDVDKSADAYDKALPALARQHDDLTKYAAAKYPIIVGAVGDKKDDVDAAIAWFKEREAAAVAAVSETAKDRRAAEQAYADRQAEVAEAQAEYAAVKDRVRALTDSVKAVTVVQTDLERAEDKSDKILMYATVVELQRLLDTVTLKPTAAYKAELDQRWSALNAAQQALRDADQKRAEATFKATEAEQALTDLRANRVDRIVDHAAEHPVPPAGNQP